MKVDFWLTDATSIAAWARGAATPSVCLDGGYDHMASSGWIKLGSREVDIEGLRLSKEGVIAAAAALGKTIEQARVEFGVRIGEMEAARANLLALTYDPEVNLDTHEPTLGEFDLEDPL
jgi:hypothetical protein